MGIEHNDVAVYDLGKFWPEMGEYDVWRENKLIIFSRHHVIISEETYSTNSGGVGLLVRGYKKDPIASSGCDCEAWGYCGSTHICRKTPIDKRENI